MAVQQKAVGQAGDLARQVQELENQLANLKGAMSRARFARWMILFMLLGFVLTFGWLFYDMYRVAASPQYQAKLTDLGTQRITKKQPELTRQVTDMFNTVHPILTKEFLEKMQADANIYMAKLEAEKKPFISEAQTELEKKLNSLYGEIVAKNRDLLEIEFPEFRQNPERYATMQGNLEIAVMEMIKKLAVKRIESEITRLIDLVDTFPEAKKPGPGDLPVGDQIYGTLIELMKMSITDLDVQPPPASARARLTPPPGSASKDDKSKSASTKAAATGAATKSSTPEKRKANHHE